jgi:hypothetical protein
MSTQPKYYLARNQQTFGPLEESQVDALRQSGQLAQYTWIFREGDAEWAAIDPAPAIPSASAAEHLTKPANPAKLAKFEQVEAPTQPRVQPQQPRLHAVPAARKLERDLYRVILFDHRNAISGWIETASDGGCIIRSDTKGSDPLFVTREAACLTLHDTRGGQSIKIRVNVAEIGRSNRGWSYQLQWREIPELLQRTSERADRSVAA